ncbi:hypothetical protein GCM10027280_20250 [Micromonospora polyrhachis]|uniref:Guanylate cyclase domain-containing protein n=1 Tax=Micromonospora polyrhachis TaxID=1282883 RepID=A0A7W7WST8_9ACTN|nr:hypothetical protein [Micromonospora polyrhachis]MBB4961758.1 hypothetical protein [Micromonospora polyrhachis]
MADPSSPNRRLLISVDMERYSRRGNLLQYEAQRAFQQMLHDAARGVGLDRVDWKTQQAGDGELAILPAEVKEPTVIGRLVPALNRLLRQYNSSRLPEARIRLRVALYQGLVHLDGANGFPGNAVNNVCRPCDAAPLKRALKAFPDAGIALIVSSDIYRDVVTEYPEELRPERFRQVEVHHPDKDFREFAWICVVDEDLGQLATLDPTAAESLGLIGPQTATGRPETPASPQTPGPHPPRGPGAADVRSADGPGAAGGPLPGGTEPGAIRTGDIRVEGQNAVGHGSMAIGSIGGDYRPDGPARR